MPRSRTLRLADGARVLVRPIAPVDRALVADVLERLSDDSRYRRFLAHRSAFTDLELDYLTDVDHRDHEALIAIDVKTGVAVGVARYVRVAPRTAELAVTVVDEWQGRGVGWRLLRLLARRARREGVDRFIAVTVAGNQPALRLLDRLADATRSGRDTHLELGARVRPRWRRLRPRRRRGRQTLSTVQALTPGAP